MFIVGGGGSPLPGGLVGPRSLWGRGSTVCLSFFLSFLSFLCSFSLSFSLSLTLLPCLFSSLITLLSLLYLFFSSVLSPYTFPSLLALLSVLSFLSLLVAVLFSHFCVPLSSLCPICSRLLLLALTRSRSLAHFCSLSRPFSAVFLSLFALFSTLSCLPLSCLIALLFTCHIYLLYLVSPLSSLFLFFLCCVPNFFFLSFFYPSLLFLYLLSPHIITYTTTGII